MGKFFNGNVKTSKSTMIKIAIVAVCAILIIVILIALNNKKNPQRANLKLYNNLDVEINSEKPETMDFFSVFDNYDVNKVKVTYPDSNQPPTSWIETCASERTGTENAVASKKSFVFIIAFQILNLRWCFQGEKIALI